MSPFWRPTVAPGLPTLPHPDLREAGPEACLAGDERRAAGGAAVLGVVVGEQQAFLRDSVDVRRLVADEPVRVGAEVRLADVVAEDHEDVRLLLRAPRGLRVRLGEQRLDLMSVHGSRRFT